MWWCPWIHDASVLVGCVHHGYMKLDSFRTDPYLPTHKESVQVGNDFHHSSKDQPSHHTTYTTKQSMPPKQFVYWRPPINFAHLLNPSN